MALQTSVKISNVNNLSDARYCAGMGVDLLGFSIEPGNENFISNEKFNEITEWISGVEYVGEFETDDLRLINDKISKYPISYVQFAHADLASAIASTGLSAIFRISAPENWNDEDFHDTINYCSDRVDFILIDGIENFEDPLTLSKLKEICERYDVFLGGNLDKKQVLKLLKKVPAKGISLKGGTEIKPGYKDFDGLADILEEIEVDDVD